MNTAAGTEPRIVDLAVTEGAIIAHLADARTVSVPLAWSWRLAGAAPEQRKRFEIIGSGEGVHWPDIDEDIQREACCKVSRLARPKRQKQGRRSGFAVMNGSVTWQPATILLLPSPPYSGERGWG